MKEYTLYLCIAIVVLAGCKSSGRKNHNQEQTIYPSKRNATYIAPICPPVPQIPITQRKHTAHSVSPDDAYQEGYDNGYEQGKSDGRRGLGHGSGYDESCDFHDYFETRYEEGYEEGYDEGYNEGSSEFTKSDEDSENEG